MGGGGGRGIARWGLPGGTRRLVGDEGHVCRGGAGKATQGELGGLWCWCVVGVVMGGER